MFCGCSLDHKSQAEAIRTWPTKAINLHARCYKPMRFSDNTCERHILSLSRLAKNPLTMYNSTTNSKIVEIY